MQYNYTLYIKDPEERKKIIAEDILREYPNLGMLAYNAAELETPFGRVHEDYWDFSEQENQINRLIDIIIVTEGKPEFINEYKKALQDINEAFRSWKSNFGYANPEEQAAYLVMEQLEKHLKDNNEPIMTYGQANDKKRSNYEAKLAAEQYKRDHTMQYNYTLYIKDPEERKKIIAEDILREYPNLGMLAYNAAELETPFGRVHEDYWDFSEQENQINRLIDIIIVTEGKPEFINEHKKALQDINEAFRSWKSNFGYANPEEQTAYLVMEQLEKHLKDNNEPLITYAEMKNQKQSKQM